MPTLTITRALSGIWAIAMGIFALIVAVTAAPLLTASPNASPALAAALTVILAAAVLATPVRDASRTPLADNKLLLLTCLTFGLLALAAAPALADDSGSVAPTEGAVITIDAALLAFLIGSVMPLLVSLVTKLDASSGVKGVLNLVLSIAGGVLAAFQASSGSLTVMEIAAAAIVVYLGSGATYSHLWKPTGTTAKIANATPRVGVG